MTFSPIISAAGAVPDSAAADPAAAARASEATTDPGIATTDPGIRPAQPAEPATEAIAGAATSQADAPATYADSAAGPGAYSAEYAGATAEAPAATGGAAAATGGAAGAAGDAAASAGDTAGSGQQDQAGAAWPHQSYLELGALSTAAPCARLHTTLVLWEWQLGALVSTAGLVVSELVSNAVQASAGLTGSRFAGTWAPGVPPVRMWLSADDHRVVIQIWDGSDRPPVPQPVQPEADSGRGLLLVGALSAEWGCYTPEKSSGKVVWAVVTG